MTEQVTHSDLLHEVKLLQRIADERLNAVADKLDRFDKRSANNAERIEELEKAVNQGKGAARVLLWLGGLVGALGATALGAWLASFLGSDRG